MKLIYPNYTNSILNVSNSILKHYNVPNKFASLPYLDKELEKKYNHIIYILLDGLGVNVLKHHLSEAQGLRKHLKQEIQSVFPSTTVAATDAVLSGFPPYVNGHLGWSQYFKEADRNIVVFKNIDYYTNEPYPINLREKYLSFKRLGEQIEEVNPQITTKEFLPNFATNGSSSFAEQVEKVLISTHNTDLSFNYVYWTEPDLTEHLYGIYSDEVHEVIQLLNSDFESLIEHITDDTKVIVIADHGLTDIEEVPLMKETKLTELLVRKPSIEPRNVTFFVKEGKETLFKDRFNNLFGDKYLLFTKEEVVEKGLYGRGIPHKKFDEFVGNFVAVAIDKYMFTLGESKGYKGHHAGLTEDEMIVPLITYSKK